MADRPEIETLKSIVKSGARSRVIVETRLQRFYLSRALAGILPSEDIITRSEFYRSLPLRKKQPESPPCSLSEICLQYISGENFPVLKEEIGADGAQPPSFTFKALGPITEFIEAYICYDDHSDIYRALVDEFGDVAGEEERLAELTRLADLVSVNRADLSAQAESERWYLLKSSLSAEEKRELALSLPQQLVFYRPTQFLPLERHFLTELCRLTSVDILIDRSLVDLKDGSALPSEAFISSTVSFIGELLKVGLCRVVDTDELTRATSKDLTAILDGLNFGDCTADLTNTSIIEVEESEPRIVAELVSGLISEERIIPSEIVVVSLDETNQPILQEALSAKKVPSVHPGGYPLSASPFPNLLRSYVDWLIHPSVESFERFYLAPQIRRSSHLQSTLNLIRAGGLGNQVFSSDLGINEGVLRQLVAINDLTGRRVIPEAISWGLAIIAEELNRVDRSVSAVRKTFHGLRYRLRELAAEGSPSERKFMARSLRAFSRILRREAATMETMERSDISAAEILRLFERRVRSASESTYLTEEIEGEAVILTGLLDTRSLIDKTVVVVGAVEDNFFRSGSAREQSPSGWMDQQLKASVGAELPGAETLSILRNLLVRSSRLYFVYSKSDGAPPRFIERLSCFANRDETQIRKLIGVLLPSSGELTRGAELLLSRKSSKITEYDGLISKSTIQRSSFDHCYAVSDLQTLSDCPHRYFFSKLLNLSEFKRSAGALFGQISGTLTHRILKDYFTVKLNPEEFLDTYALPWELPEYRQLRRTILSLYLPVADTISAALGTKILYTEWAFKKENSLRLNGEVAPIQISGVIDRIDLIEEIDNCRVVAVWDYKTSAAATRGVESAIQVPLYALAINAGSAAQVRRGGLLLLNSPGLDEIDLSDVIRGPIREQLGLIKKGRGWVVDPASIGATLEQTTSLVYSLDSRVTNGLLHQTINTPALVCERCEFRNICARDELLLEQKEGESSEVELPEISSKPLQYRLYFDRYSPIAEITPSDQQHPAGDPSSSFVVHAGAGAGKTATMVHRVLSLLLAGNSISSIVTVTFTKKAAAELRYRIKRAIAGAIERGQGDGLLLARAFYELERAQIGTIHSFCHRLLSISPNVSRHFFRPEMIDGIVLGDIQDGAVNATVDQLSSDDLSAILSSKLKIWELRVGLGTLLKNALELSELCSTYLCDDDRRQQILKLLVEIHRKESIDAAAKIHKYLAEWLPGVESWVGVSTKLSDEHREKFIILVALAKRLCAEYLTDSVSEDYCQVLDELLAYADEHSAAQRRKSKDTPANYWKALRDTLTQQSKQVVPTAALPATEEELFNQAQQIVSLAQRAYQRVQSYKISNGLASFDDVIQAVHEFLVSGDPYSAVLSRSIKHVLIDEFQDTDAIQWEIFKGMKPTTIFIVGDYQQAIYGFRGGEISVFERAEKEIIAAGGRVIILDDNYRSRPAIIEFVNDFFQDLFLTDSGRTKIEARQMQPRRTNGGRALEGVFRSDAGGRDNIAQANRVAAVVGEIRERNPGEEIAIIARTSTQISRICGALSRANLPYVVLHSGDFYDREEIKLFYNLFAWLSAAENMIALVGVLRSALFGLSDDELLRSYGDAGQEWSRFTGSDHPAAIVLRELKQLARRYSAVELIGVIMERFGLEQTYRVTGNNSAISNIELLKAQLKVAARSGLNVYNSAAVADWIARRPGVSKDDLTSAHQDEQIKIMTIHGAKGLEFENVILPFLERRPPGHFDFIIGELSGFKLLGMRYAEGDNQKRKRTLTQQALDHQNKLKERGEERRVFYVACTRARDSLVLLNNERDGDKVDAITSCRNSASASLWVKQLVTDGEEITLSGSVSLYRAQPVRFAASGFSPDSASQPED